MQEKRLSESAKQLSAWLTSPAGAKANLTAVANTLSQRRSQYDYRVSFVVRSHDEAVKALDTFAAGDDGDVYTKGRVLGTNDSSDLSRAPVWIFSGHGAQWAEMGRELLHDKHFRLITDSLDPLIYQEAGWSPFEALETGNVDDTERVQVLTYFVQIGLSGVLASKGLRPRAAVGHSLGEIAASVIAGCLTPEEGAIIVTRRAKLYNMIRAQSVGGMALVNIPFDQAQAELRRRDNLYPAIDSSPSSCVVAGTADAIDDYMIELKARNLRAFRVKTDVAFHTPILDRISAPLAEALAGELQPRPPVIPLYSTSADDARSTCWRDTSYWVSNMVSPVALRSAINAAAEDGHRIFVEVSTHPILLHSVNETLNARGLDDEEFGTVGTMKRNASASDTIHDAVSKLFVLGTHVDFESLNGHKRWWCPDVPGTPWLHKRFWKHVETGQIGNGSAKTHDVEKHTLLGQRVPVADTNTVVYATKLDDKTKPFPGTHPLEGTEIIPAAVYINTFHHATGGTELSEVQLSIPVSMGADTRDVQIIVQGAGIRVVSTSSADDKDASWVSHSSCKWSTPSTQEVPGAVDIDAVRSRIGTKLPNNFSTDYLFNIGVEGIAFPWAVTEHFGNEKEMLVKVDMDPSLADAAEMPWDAVSWAPLLDAATSIGSTIFFNEPKLRIVHQIDRVSLYSRDALPQIGYLHVEEAADSTSLAAHVTVLAEDGTPLAKFHSLRLSEVEGASGVSGGVDSLVHRLAWVPVELSENPRELSQVVVVCSDHVAREAYARQLQRQKKTSEAFFVGSAEGLLQNGDALAALARKSSALVYVPSTTELVEQVADASEEFVWATTQLAKVINDKGLAQTCKLFVVTDSVHAGESTTGLAHGPLYGLARIIASEHPDLWGGLIDTDTPEHLPIMPLKYASKDQSVLRMIDGVPRRAILRPFSRDQRLSADGQKPLPTLLPHPGGTYIITGGMGGLGLETSKFLVEKGARRIVLLSRSGLPPRSQWSSILKDSNHKLHAAIQHILHFETLGATIHAVALDIAAPGAAQALQKALDFLSLPPVRGVIHAAGVLEDNYVVETTRGSFSRVMAPKVRGAIALHQAFPPAAQASSESQLDFFIMYSSIGQLVGTAGQGSYAAGNAFLDALATHRRERGDNAVAFQFTAWRDVGMVATNDFVKLEFEAKGITDISAEEAFRAWEHAGKHETDHAVVTRIRPIDEGEAAPIPLLDQVVVRRARPSTGSSGGGKEGGAAPSNADARPTAGPELQKWLNVKIKECIAAVLLINDIEDIEDRTALSDMGVDSVVTVSLRQKLQSVLKVKVPPTLTWNHPTVNHLVTWFVGKFEEDSS